MNALQRGIINIICSALTGETLSIPKDFSLSDGALLARRHKIEALFYYGALNCGISSDEKAMRELFVSVCQNIAVSERQMHSVNEIFTAFDKAEIEYMPLKGTLLKDMYPKREMRSMGDADILIKTEQYDKIKAVMQSLRYDEILESDHELIWDNKGLCHIELHKRLIPSYNKDYYSYFGDGWRLATVKNGTRYSMTDEDQMIYLFTHFAKHYRDAGIGIKHLTDLWVYRRCKPTLDEDYIKKELSKLQLYDFYLNILNTLSVWFEGKAADEKAELITAVIFDSGVYGTGKAHILSEGLKASKSTSFVRLRKYLRLIFPKFKDLSNKYPILERHPILLPLMWVRRALNIFTKHTQVKATIDKVDKMRPGDIKSYQDSLNFVGLDFNFKE